MSLIEGLFPSFVQTSELFTFPGRDSLFPSERYAIRTAGAIRHAEFAAGRVCAREALAKLDVERGPLLPGADRLPIWPTGARGSISHTREYCAAGVCLATDAEAIGLDVEPAVRLEPELVDSVCLPDEQAWAAEARSEHFELLTKLLFSAKECAYKCQFPLTGRFLEFRDVRISVDLRSATFRAEVRGFVDLQGRFLIDQDLIATGIVLGRR